MKKSWVAFLAISILLTGCSKQNATETIELIKPVSLNVDTAVVCKDTIDSMSQYPAYVVPYTEELSFLVSGTLSSIEVSMGEKVEKGQVLATLDESGLMDQIDELKNSIKNTKKNNYFTNTSIKCDIDIMNLELRRLEEEYQKSSDQEAESELKLSIEIVKSDIKIAETKLSQAIEIQKLDLKKQEQELVVLSQKAGKNTLTAPFTGEIVFITDTPEKSNIEAGQTVIIIADRTKLHLESEYISEQTLKNSNRYYAFIDDEEYEISYVPMDFSVYLKIVLYDGTPKTSFNLKQDVSGLSAGDYVNIRVLSKYKQKVLTIPLKAVYTDAEGKYVYLMEGASKVRTSINTGITADNEVEVTSGLEEGDVVYVAN